MSAPRIITADAFVRALAGAGVIRNDLNRVSRIVIDAKGGHAVRIYVELDGDERLLQVAQTLEGVEISSTPAVGGSIRKSQRDADRNAAAAKGDGS